MTVFTDNLGLTEIEQGQSGKEVLISADLVLLDSAIAGSSSKALSGAGPTTLSAAESTNVARMKFTGSPTAGHVAKVPAGKKHLWAVTNGCTVRIAVGDGTGAAVTVESGATVFVYYDGTDCLQVTPTTPYDIGFSTDDAQVYSNGQIVLRHAPVRAFLLKASLSGARGGCIVAPTGSISVALKKNGSSIGSIDIASGATTATFTFASEVAFTTSDILTIVAPATADATLAGVWATLPGFRT